MNLHEAPSHIKLIRRPDRLEWFEDCFHDADGQITIHITLEEIDQIKYMLEEFTKESKDFYWIGTAVGISRELGRLYTLTRNSLHHQFEAIRKRMQDDYEAEGERRKKLALGKLQGKDGGSK